ncbi:mitochondrial carrier protein [Planoprotostelium fungivorum]|uniref:Mitochondrial carrier protein n=1 Tax=Planoprotostelium fungivorum TaxID=1890364 RepID=A0A2P6NYW8_9EUKA|nr:mitochondrial carrier protein [Planoprotostelium fungivorum]
MRLFLSRGHKTRLLRCSSFEYEKPVVGPWERGVDASEDSGVFFRLAELLRRILHLGHGQTIMPAEGSTQTPTNVPKRSPKTVRALTVARDIFAGTMSGIAVTIVGHPFDTLKVRLQTQPSPPLYSGVVDCFKKTIKWEGPLGLYKGIASPITGQVFFRANMFFSFAEAKRFLSGYGSRPLRNIDYFIAGGFAWFTGTFFECPIDLVKSQLQVQVIRSKTIPDYVAPYTNMTQCASAIVRTNGFFGLYQGFVPHVLRNIPAGSVHLGSYEMVRQHYSKKKGVPVSELPSSYSLLGGGIGGFLYWSIFFPIDVVKSSIQTDNLQKDKRKFSGAIDAAKKLYAEGGWKRFYRGFTPCLMRSIPANAMMLWTVAFITDNLPIRQ